MATKMKLADFYGYVRENRKRISDIYREIEEIQFQFNDLYAQQQAERNKLIAAYAPHLMPDADEALPAQLEELLGKRTQVERQAVREEVAKLEVQVGEQRERSDDVVRQAQHQVAQLREKNPILDRQEEELKARGALMAADSERLDAELRSLSWFPVGWVTNMFKRRRLRQEREQVRSNLEAVKNGIRQVREKWQEEKSRLEEAQSDLQNQWQTVSVEASQLQARLDYLTASFEQESTRNAAWNLLGSLTEEPVLEGAWAERLPQLVELTNSKTEYESGLRSVAEILGLLKGLAEGMDRFIRSVATVYEEQRRYKLPALTVTVSKAVTSFHAIWPDLQAKVKDEKYLGTHPMEFERRISAIVPEQLGEKAIQTMFEDMGSALSEATESWQ